MHQQKTSPHIPTTNSLHRGPSSKNFDSPYQLNHSELSPSNNSKNAESWAYRPLQPEISKSLPSNKVVVKCNFKTMDWQLVSHNMSASHPNPATTVLKKKENPSNAAKKEININTISRPMEIPERTSPLNHDFDPLQRRPITVILSSKNKSDARGKVPKSIYESMGLNVAGQGVNKKISSKEELEDAEAIRKLGHNMTPSLRLGTSTGAKVRSEGLKEGAGGVTSIMNLEEKGSSGDKLVHHQHEEGRRGLLGTTDKGFRMRKWVHEGSTSVGSTPVHKVKASPGPIYKVDEQGFRGFPLNMKSDTEAGSLGREDMSPIAMRSEKVRSLKSEENESKNIFLATAQSIKLRTYRLDRILNSDSKHAQKRTTPKLEFESHGEIPVAQLEEDDGATVKLKKATSLGVKIAPKKIEGPSPREVARALKMYRPALEELLGPDKDSQTIENLDQEENTISNGQVRQDVASIGNMNERSMRSQWQKPMSMTLKSGEFQGQDREAVESVKVTIPTRQGLSLTRVPTLGRGDNAERSNERQNRPHLVRKDSIGNLEKQGKRNNVAVVVEDTSFTAAVAREVKEFKEVRETREVREDQMTFLERKLINQCGKGDVIEGWDLGLNESEPDSPIVFSPWGKKKVVNE